MSSKRDIITPGPVIAGYTRPIPGPYDGLNSSPFINEQCPWFVWMEERARPGKRKVNIEIHCIRWDALYSIHRQTASDVRKVHWDVKLKVDHSLRFTDTNHWTINQTSGWYTASALLLLQATVYGPMPPLQLRTVHYILQTRSQIFNRVGHWWRMAITTCKSNCKKVSNAFGIAEDLTALPVATIELLHPKRMKFTPRFVYHLIPPHIFTEKVMTFFTRILLHKFKRCCIVNAVHAQREMA